MYSFCLFWLVFLVWFYSLLAHIGQWQPSLIFAIIMTLHLTTDIKSLTAYFISKRFSNKIQHKLEQKSCSTLHMLIMWMFQHQRCPDRSSVSQRWLPGQWPFSIMRSEEVRAPHIPPLHPGTQQRTSAASPPPSSIYRPQVHQQPLSFQHHISFHLNITSRS